MQQHLRKLVMVLRKGGLYRSVFTPSGSIKSILLRPPAETTGAGGRGVGRAINDDGKVVLTMMGDRAAQELIVLD